MAVELATGYVSIVPSAKNFGRNLGKEIVSPLERSGQDAGRAAAKGVSSKFRLGLKDVAKIAAGAFIARGAIAGVRFLGREIKSFVTEARESAKIGRLTNAVIKSTGGISNVTAAGISELATRLSNLSGVDDELIQSGENVLLTFTNIRNTVGKGNNIFDQATTAALNLSAALGQDMQSSVIQVGKALNDPIKGVTALRRVGVSFTAQQVDQIKVLVASGKTLEAQKLILKELGTEFGGAAAAAADPLARLSVIAGNFKEQLGGALLPVLSSVADKLSGFLPIVANALTPIVSSVLPPFIAALQGGISLITPFLGQVATAVGGVLRAIVPIFKGLQPTIAQIGSSFLLIFKALLPLIPAFGRLIQAVAPLGVALSTLVLQAVRALVPLITPLVGILTKIAQAFIGGAQGAGPLSQVLFVIADAFNILGKLLKPIIPLIANLVADLITGLVPVLPELARTFRELLVALAPLVPELAKLAITLIHDIGIPTIVTLAKAFAVMATALVPLASQTKILVPLVAALGTGFIALKAIKTVQNGLLGLASASGTAVGTIQRLAASTAAQKVASFAAAAATKALAVAQAILNAVMDANPIVLVIAAIVAIGLAIFIAYKKFKPFRDIVDAVGRALAKAFDFVKRNWKLILGLLLAPFIALPILVVKNFDKIKAFLGRIIPVIGRFGLNLLEAIVRGLATGLPKLVLFLTVLLPARIIGALVGLIAKLTVVGVRIMRGLLAGFFRMETAIAKFYLSLPGKIVRFIGNVSKTLFTKGVALLRGLLDGAISFQIGVLNFYKNLPGRVVTAIGAVGRFLFNKGIALLRGLRDGAADFIPALFRFFTSLPGKIIEKLGDVTTWLFDIGGQIIGGLIDGVKDAVLGIGSKIGDVAGKAKDAVVDGFKGAFGIGSPSKVMADRVGRPIAEGVASGMRQGFSGMSKTISDAERILTAGWFKVAAAMAERNKNLEFLRSGVFKGEGFSKAFPKSWFQGFDSDETKNALLRIAAIDKSIGSTISNTQTRAQAARSNNGKIADTINIHHVKDNDDAVRKLTWAAKTRGR